MKNTKFWVSDLSEKALVRLKKNMRRILDGEGIYSTEEIDEIIQDLPTNKLDDIADAVGSSYLDRLINME